MRDKDACPLCGSKDTFYSDAWKWCGDDDCRFIAFYTEWERASLAMWRERQRTASLRKQLKELKESKNAINER